LNYDAKIQLFSELSSEKRKNLSLFFYFSGTIDPDVRADDRTWIPMGSVTVKGIFLGAFLLGSIKGSLRSPGNYLAVDPSGIDRTGDSAVGGC
jgi:hypothetical protein